MLYTVLHKFLLVVLRLIESDHKVNSEFLENRHVVIWGEGAVLICYIQWSRKSNELVRHNPIEIAVLHFLKVLILLHVKSFIVIPSQSHG